MPKKNNYTKELLQPLIQQSKSISDVLRHLNLVLKGGNFKTIKNKIIEYELDVSHFSGQGWSKGLTKQTSKIIKNQSIKNTKHTIHSSLKEDVHLTSTALNRLLDEYGLKKQCKECGLTEYWNNKKLTLHIDHINGINTDNRITNLRYLCPNCHSQTDTYCSRNGARRGT